jgi:hypothetical protein
MKLYGATGKSFIDTQLRDVIVTNDGVCGRTNDIPLNSTWIYPALPGFLHHASVAFCFHILPLSSRSLNVLLFLLTLPL